MKNLWMMTIALAAVLSGCEQPTQMQPAQNNPLLVMEEALDPQRPPTPQTMYVMAEILISQGYEPRAESLLKRIRTEYPEFLPACNTLAEVQMRVRRIPEAMATLQSGLTAQPSDPVLWNNLGMCWLIRQDYQNALDCFVRAAGIRPENTRYRSNMATALALLGRRDEALALYKQILPQEKALENVRLLSLEVTPKTQKPSPD